MRAINVLYCGIVFLSGCDYYSSYIEVVNKTEKPIIFDLATTDTLDLRPPYTISEIKTGLRNLDGKGSNFVLADSSTRVFTSDWKAVIQSEYADQTLRIFIFDPDTLQRYPWPKIRSENKYLHKFSIPLEALEQTDWRIVYSDSLLFRPAR